MSQTDALAIAQQIEHSPTSRDGHTHNFDGAYQQIVQLQQSDGGPNSQQFHQDMAALNNKLHQDGLITNLEIVGADSSTHQLITRDIADNRTANQDAQHVKDFGNLGSGSSGREAADAMLAKAFGINVSRNPDGSYDVEDPLADPQKAAAGILNTVFNGLINGGSDSGSPLPVGMNPLMARAWRDDPTPPEPPQPDPPDDQ